MKVDVFRLMSRPFAEQARMLSALRFADLVVFREACADVCRYLTTATFSGPKRSAWLAFVRHEFARDAREVPEAAVAAAFIELVAGAKDRAYRKRVAAARKGCETLRAKGKGLFGGRPGKYRIR